MDPVGLGRAGLTVSRPCLGRMTRGEPERGNDHPQQGGGQHHLLRSELRGPRPMEANLRAVSPVGAVYDPNAPDGR